MVATVSKSLGYLTPDHSANLVWREQRRSPHAPVRGGRTAAPQPFGQPPLPDACVTALSASA